MFDPILSIRSHHAADCGAGPFVDGDDPHLYLGYFENSQGEQWIFSFHRQTRKAQLHGGDSGWKTAYDVRKGTVTELILSSEEKAWLQACWKAASGE
jgi:hypothetical protein